MAHRDDDCEKQEDDGEDHPVTVYMYLEYKRESSHLGSHYNMYDQTQWKVKIKAG